MCACTELLNQRVSVSQSCFLCAQIALKQYHELPNIDCSTPESLEKNKGVCSTDLPSRPIRLSVTRTGVRKSITFANNKCFRLPTFFVYTVDKEAVTSCKFAMQAEEVCVYTSVKFDLCSVFASVRASVR